jgi:NDP-sugar pyrophosphorylase family protein
MKPTLLILAAGMGSRYGGMKQLDKLGPSGETIMEYSLYDAIRAGFEKVVFVIRRSFAQEFDDKIIKRLRGYIAIDTVFQDMDDLPVSHIETPDRYKPWGTGHAIWVARKKIREPFAVINADDFYGKEAFTKMAEFLGVLKPDQAETYAMCGYPLGNTLSTHGAVSRGVCQLSPEGYLQKVTENTAIQKRKDGKIISTGGEKPLELSETDTVSMNFWGFSLDLFSHLEKHFQQFIEDQGQDPKAEFYIPFVVDQLIQQGKVRVKVLQSQSRWFGVTYQEDKNAATEALREMTDAGEYPEKLF